MVGWGDDDVDFLAAALDVIGRVGDARCGVSSCRLAQHLVGLEHGQVLQNELFVGLVGHHEEILVGDDGAETLVGATDEAFARAQYVEELLGIVVLAEGPETASDAAGHDDAVVVHRFFVCFEDTKIVLFGVTAIFGDYFTQRKRISMGWTA